MWKLIKKILLISLCILILAIGFILYQGHNMYKSALEESNLKDKITNIREDKNYIKLDNLPDYYKNAIISVEDHRFYKHGPIDIIAIGRAVFNNISNGELLEGGSTITQQVAKNLYFISEDINPIYRKIAEIFIAYDLEKQYEKYEILELYINTIYFGDGYYGIQEACLGYFDKAAQDMTLYEATMMAGVPNAPSIYAPTANLNLTLNRQKKVIYTMVENGYLSQEQADKLVEAQPEI